MKTQEIGDEAGLVHHALAGSGAAFALLVRRHEASVRWFLARAVRDPATADDLAQEVFLCLHQHLAEYRGDGPLRAWLLGIARNLAAQHMRAIARRREREAGVLQVQLAEWRMERLARNPQKDEDCERAFAALHDCVRELAPESRRVVEAHYFRGQTIAAIARQQGRNGGAVRMMLLRIRQVLGECLRRKLGHEV
jgi:RNA polymerase sigma-70 factor (ECF subfamily)